jgi:hypothetical protein
MPVETQLLIGQIVPNVPTTRESVQWFQVYVQFDMRHFFADALEEIRDRCILEEYPQVSLYDLDGNKEHFTDKLGGHPLQAVPFKEFYNAVKSAYKQDRGYRRLAWLRALMASMNANGNKGDMSVVIYHY